MKKLKFTISDTGIGIKPENIKKLFLLYQNSKSNEESKFKIQGIGLGLIISNELLKMLEKHNENLISVESKYGEGSTFTFEVSVYPNDYYDNDISEDNKNIRDEEEFSFLKVRQSPIVKSMTEIKFPHEETMPATKPIELPNKKEIKIERTDLKVLVVDDEPFCLDVVVKLLNSFGIYDTKMAPNGMEALTIIRDEAKKNCFFDIIVMDCDMPVMDGFECSRIINQMINSFKNNIIFFCELSIF